MVNEKGMTFNSLEREIYRYVCEKGCVMLSNIFEKMDKELKEKRDRRIYRHKGKRKTAIKTMMGTVEYSRAVYQVKDGEIGKKHVYLLDEVIQRETIGLFSVALAESIVASCCEMPYRKASQSVSGMSGQCISHTGAWNVVQSVGKRMEQGEERAGLRAKEGQGHGVRESKLLFEEQDGVWLKLQGKDRKKHGQAKEMKLCIAYDGAKKTGKKRYELQHKIACANFEDVAAFCIRKEGMIADYYATDEIEMRVLNGDGAQWIKRSAESDDVHYQLDTFHRNRAIVKAVKYTDMRKNIFKHLYDNQIESALECIEILSNSVEDERERQELLKLHRYLCNNKDGLIGYHRRDIELPAPPAGLVYRRLGAMESNVFSLVGFRMKRRRAVWSIAGGNNMARLLCLKATKRLTESLHNVMRVVLPPRYTQEVTATLHSGRISKSIGKGYDGFHHFAPPSAKCESWIKDLMGQKTFSSLTLK